MLETTPDRRRGRQAAGGETGESTRPVFYLFRTGVLPPTPLARFTDRSDALAAARSVERMGWTVSVLWRLEDRVTASDARWRHAYRSRRRRRAPRTTAA